MSLYDDGREEDFINMLDYYTDQNAALKARCGELEVERDAAYARGRQDERRAVVEWLRSDDEATLVPHEYDDAFVTCELARRIERGEHVAEASGGKGGAG